MYKYIIISITTLLLLSCNDQTTNSETTQTNQQVAINNDINIENLPYEEVPFLTLDNKTVKISDYKGQRVLLNFWATWCRPCVMEMPSMNSAYQILKDEGYVFLAASNEKIKLIDNFAKNNNYSFDFVKADDEFRPFNIRVIPTTLIFDASGKLATTLTGSMIWDDEAVLKQLRAIK